MKNLRMKAARAAKDMSQQELADAVNISIHFSDPALL